MFFTMMILSVLYSREIGNSLILEQSGLINFWFCLTLLLIFGIVIYLYVKLPTQEENIEESPSANWKDLYSVKVKSI
jgi:hypothetical protein